MHVHACVCVCVCTCKLLACTHAHARVHVHHVSMHSCIHTCTSNQPFSFNHLTTLHLSAATHHNQNDARKKYGSSGKRRAF